jgi:hypothetical protein
MFGNQLASRKVLMPQGQNLVGSNFANYDQQYEIKRKIVVKIK